MTLPHCHIQLAHQWWRELITPGDLAVDATCGNGHDTLFLLQLGCRVIACDLQESAVQKSRERTQEFPEVEILQTCHADLAATLDPASVRLVVFNLGYLPGSGNKELTTRTETTLLALQRFLPTLLPGGALCITCYPGHPEGAKEEEALIQWASSLPAPWRAAHQRWLSPPRCPSLLLLQNITNNYNLKGPANK